MKLTRLFADDDAVSPVIGVILMVAITVILAAVIGAFVLGIGDDPAAAPQVTMDTDEGTNDSTGDVQYVVFEVSSVGSNAPVADDLSVVAGGNATSTDVGSGGTLGVGSTINVTMMGSGDAPSSGDEVTVVWSDGDTEQPIGSHRLSADAEGAIDGAST